MRELAGEYQEQLRCGEGVIEGMMWLLDRDAGSLRGRTERIVAPLRFPPLEAVDEDREAENVDRSTQPPSRRPTEQLRQEGSLHPSGPREQVSPIERVAEDR